jgi:hypothetical protein
METVQHTYRTWFAFAMLAAMVVLTVLGVLAAEATLPMVLWFAAVGCAWVWLLFVVPFEVRFGGSGLVVVRSLRPDSQAASGRSGGRQGGSVGRGSPAARSTSVP